MLKWLLRRGIESFERKWNYDASYLKEIADLSSWAALKFALATSLGSDRSGVPLAALCAAGITAVRSEDCGPCTQLGVTMAERQGVAPEILRALLQDDVAAMPDDVALVWRFTRATLAHDETADDYRARDRQALGAARRGDARLCDHDGTHVSHGEVRDGPRQDLLASRRRRRTAGDRSRPDAQAMATDLELRRRRAGPRDGPGGQFRAAPAPPARPGLSHARLAGRGGRRRAGRLPSLAHRRSGRGDGFAGVPDDGHDEDLPGRPAVGARAARGIRGPVAAGAGGRYRGAGPRCANRARRRPVDRAPARTRSSLAARACSVSPARRVRLLVQ